MGVFPLEDVGTIKSMSAFEGARSALLLTPLPYNYHMDLRARNPACSVQKKSEFFYMILSKQLNISCLNLHNE